MASKKHQEVVRPLVKLRLSKYLTVVPYQNYFLIIQGNRGAIILIKKKTWYEIEANACISDGRSKLEKIKIKLLGKGILVPEGVDEISSIKKIFKENLAQAGKDCYLGLYLTLRCNFACPYCFLDEKQSDITEEIIDKSLENFFEKIKEVKAENAKIDFWGGEPLLCLDKLEYAVRKARALNEQLKKKIEFRVVTNGSIFNPRILSIFSKEKDLAYVQITLDGPQNIHDRRRFFKGGRGSYQIILKNLELWMKIAKKIVLRVNVVLWNAI